MTSNSPVQLRTIKIGEYKFEIVEDFFYLDSKITTYNSDDDKI